MSLRNGYNHDFRYEKEVMEMKNIIIVFSSVSSSIVAFFAIYKVLEMLMDIEHAFVISGMVSLPIMIAIFGVLGDLSGGKRNDRK